MVQEKGCERRHFVEVAMIHILGYRDRLHYFASASVCYESLRQSSLAHDMSVVKRGDCAGCPCPRILCIRTRNGTVDCAHHSHDMVSQNVPFDDLIDTTPSRTFVVEEARQSTRRLVFFGHCLCCA